MKAKSIPMANLHKIRVLVADDHPVVRQGVIANVKPQRDMMVVAEADTETRKQESLGTKDRAEAKSLLKAGTIFTLSFFRRPYSESELPPITKGNKNWVQGFAFSSK